MKFTLNGAITIGIFDSANIEICEEVEEDSIVGLQVVDADRKNYPERNFIG